jgi:hypothetical protein
MNMKARKNSPANELQFELKYCERCGGLGLRPVGGGQIYCAACWRQMAQLPPGSKEPENTIMQQKPRWDGADNDLENGETAAGEDLDAGGVA